MTNSNFKIPRRSRMKKHYDTIFFIGRFQPFHKGHMSVVMQALEEHTPNDFIFIVGSTNKTGTPKNPFSFASVTEIIQRSLSSIKNDTHTVFDYVSVPDYTYNDSLWLTRVQEIMSSYKAPDDETAIIGFKKDDSSYYLDKFPNVDLIEADDTTGLSATDIRDKMFTARQNDILTEINMDIPVGASDFMYNWVHTDKFSDLREEYASNLDYDPTKYDNTVLVTADAVVHCDGHILMIKRGQNPGKGKWALPGGFIDKGERVVDAIFRELKEETKIDVPIGKIRNSLKGIDYFDDISRSQRARTITFAGFIDIRGEKKLPKVKGADDAAEAFWVPISELISRSTDFADVHEDHGDIAREMINRYYR